MPTFSNPLFAQAAVDAAAETAAYGFENVGQNRGFALAIVGMLVVFVSLAMIAGFIAALPKLLHVLEPWLPQLHGESHASRSPKPAETTPDREKQIIAAIGHVLRQEMQRVKKSP